VFWKRKPKKQEGPEATDSAAEVAVDDKEEVVAADADADAVVVTPSADEDEAADTKDADPADAVVEDAPDEAPVAADAAVTTDEAVTTGKADDAPAAEKPVVVAAAVDTDTVADETETETETETEADAETEAEDAKDAKDDDEADKPVGMFADASEEAGVTGPDDDGITRVRSVGVFEFDEEKFDVVSNTWIVKADDDGVVVIDPGFDAEAILEAVGEREIYLVACTNAYSPHIESAIKVAEEAEADIALHPREMRAWRRHHGAEHRPEIEVEGQGALDIGDLHIDVLALPGTSSGSVGYYFSELGVVFSGDALRKGEPGMVGNTYIDYTTQLASIGEALLSLPPDTRILPDRGPSTTSGAESKNFDSWV